MMNEISATARDYGVDSEYYDVFGNRHVVGEATLRAIVTALAAGAGAQCEPTAGIAVSPRAYQGDGARTWALAVQLYAVRSARNWGIGDFGDLGGIVKLAAASGAAAVGLNPLHALFLDTPERISPYAPNSRLFLNPLYIDVEAIDELGGDPSRAGEIAALRASELVDYPRVAALKVKALRQAYENFRTSASPARRRDFDSFRAEQSESLMRFSCFEVLRRRYAPSPWREWPAPWSHPDTAAVQEFRRTEDVECGFHEFLQWNAHRQLAHCADLAKQCGMPIGLYLDLAVGVDPEGADAWSNQKAVLAGLSIGAPPDALNRAGQNWGLAPFNPRTMSADDFAVMRRLMDAAMRYAGAVRLDHVLGLMRLYLIPRGDGEGTYVRFPFEALLRVIAEESQRHRCIFIGEDLGTVPGGFRETAARWGIWLYRVMIFERWGNGEFKPPSDYPADSLASFNTHDLPTFRGWMTSHDIATKHALGLDPGESTEAREQAHGALRRAVSPYMQDAAPDAFAAVAAFLAATPARLVSVAIEDLLDMADQTNIPGTVDEHPNWRRKLPVSLEDWAQQPTFAKVVGAFAQGGRAVKR